jgi:succinate-semialdehyde dehydrogenase / glutarate-semialdehyde dehydrogenase
VSIESRNPATGELVQSYEPLDRDQLEERMELAWSTFKAYRGSAIEERAGWLSRAAEILEADKRDFGRIMTEEMGKPLAASIAEVEKCAWVCRHYAEHAGEMLADESVDVGDASSFVRYAPLGPILAVMPWNFPFWQVFRFAAPALAAGNVGLLKHASNVPRCALTIEDIFARAGFPRGSFQTLLLEVDEVARVIDDERVRAATLTGSTRAGSAVAERAGKRIKKTVLELGGSDPFVVLPSADLDLAIRTAVTARTINNGQSCIAAKRFIVHEEVYDRFVTGFVEGMERLRIGDPMEDGVDIGPLATPAIIDEVEEQVRRTVAAGARLLTGGHRVEGAGNYYAPTALADIPRGSPAYEDEIFGPVAAIFRVPDVDAAIRLANDSPFGLGSSAWTGDEAEAAALIDGIEAGQVFINAMVASDPRLPFGGVKESGYGRELGVWGIREFVNIKTVWIGGMARTSTE